MHTYYIGKEEVLGYSRDLIKRLKFTLEDDFPNIWCPIGFSGEVLLSTLDEVFPEEIRSKLKIVPLITSPQSKNIKFENPRDRNFVQKNAKKTILILDSNVHSGISMLNAIRTVSSLGAKKITTYSLTVKKEASYIPNYFGVIISEHDRPLFLLDEIPNNRLTPFGIIRKITKDDMKRKKTHLKSGLHGIDSITWSDLFYSVEARNDQAYVFELDDEICGFVSFKLTPGQNVFVDAVGVDKFLQGKKIGGQLMRFVETLARANCCLTMSLWAISNRVKFYEGHDYKVIDNKNLDLHGELYFYMQRKLVYNSNYKLLEFGIPSTTIQYRN